MIITLDNHTFTLSHHTSKRIKRVSVVLQSKDHIVVKTPLKFKAHLIKEVVYGYKEWILKTIQKVPRKEKFDIDDTMLIPYLGEKLPAVLVEDNSIQKVKIKLLDHSFKVLYNKDCKTHEDIMEGLKIFYKYQAYKIIDPLFDIWCHQTKLYPQKISYRYNKTRWGSCSHQNNISINYKLIQFDQKAIEYVVLHELCHIKEKNHSKRFWDLLSHFMPDYKLQERKLRFGVL